MKFIFFLLFCFHRVRHCAAAPAQSRSTNFVQYFLGIGTPVDSTRRAKTTLSAACLPNEQRITLAGAARSTLNIQHRMPNGRGWGSATGGYRFFLASWFPDFYDL